MLCARSALAFSATEGFDGFLLRFRAALQASDTAAIAGMTRLPFLFEGEPRERAAFMDIVPVLFDAPVRACIAAQAAIPEEDARVIFCDRYAFYFRRAPDGAWRLEEFAADGEAVR